MIHGAAVALLLWPAPAGAMDARAFKALTMGRTLHFLREGAPFGAEQFLPGRRTLWRFEAGACQQGRWWAEGEAICFSYDTDPAPICWSFHAEAGGHAAELLEGGLPTGFRLTLERLDAAPLPCPGPEVGS